MKKLSLVCAAVFALGTAACGGDDDGGGGDNADPTADFTATPDCTTMAQSISVSSTSSDPDGDAITCTWSFDGGNPSSATTCDATTMFPNLRPYAVTLTISDGNGGSDNVTQTIGPCI